MLKEFLMPGKYFLISLLCVIVHLPAFCQARSNLEIFYNLIDSSGSAVAAKLPRNEKEINLKLNLGSSYSLFSNHLLNVFYKNGFSIKKDSGLSIMAVNYVLDDARVEYGDIFRDGFFGSYKLSRKIEISGNYLIQNSSYTFKKFNYNYIDTVKVNDIKFLENVSYPFTQGVVPPEPFFSSLFEPLVAVGTAAIAVFLFFTIRSK